MKSDELGASPSTTREPINYVALTAGGLEEHSVQEIKVVFGVETVQIVGLPPACDQWAPDGPAQVFPGSAGVAKLCFSLPAPSSPSGWLAQRQRFALLKCSQCVLALIEVQSTQFYPV